MEYIRCYLCAKEIKEKDSSTLELKSFEAEEEIEEGELFKICGSCYSMIKKYINTVKVKL